MSKRCICIRGSQMEEIKQQNQQIFLTHCTNISSIHSKSWRPWRPVSANFFHFLPKFRLRTRKPSRLHCTNASPSVCRLCFVFNINTSYIDLLYFDNLLLKTPDLCNLRTFVAIFLSQFTHFFCQFLEWKKQTPPIYPLLECMPTCQGPFWHSLKRDKSEPCSLLQI